MVILSAALPDAFLLIFDPLMGDHNQLDRVVKKLSLPRSVVNIRYGNFSFRILDFYIEIDIFTGNLNILGSTRFAGTS